MRKDDPKTPHQNLLIGVIEQAVVDYRQLLEAGIIGENKRCNDEGLRSNWRSYNSYYRSPDKVNLLCAFINGENLEKLMDMAGLNYSPEMVRSALHEKDGTAFKGASTLGRSRKVPSIFVGQGFGRYAKAGAEKRGKGNRSYAR